MNNTQVRYLRTDRVTGFMLQFKGDDGEWFEPTMHDERTNEVLDVNTSAETMGRNFGLIVALFITAMICLLVFSFASDFGWITYE